ncbi:glycoside hydrolase family 61 protein-like protein [Massariosphaeria phaeospora]|uniref:AA9 family lytic polysaccharide monooxygenase n=1 Tax=Massariosphaeria phaeospora TaxID=100035 RepID=A0A7C8M532_9PLEO|nr:glycoside hydrolase family 61 protein-like protein [Massariosphaeria phaeospora]
MWHLLAPIFGCLAQYASAHGGAVNYTVGDTWYPGYDPYAPQEAQDLADWMPQRKWTTNEPIFQPSNLSLACNFPGTPARASIPITAGATITAVYYSWVHTVGPMVAWMAHCGADCRALDASAAAWFKIGEKGLQAGDIETGDWFQKTFSRWDGAPSLWSERVPAALRPGKYLIRHEIISLHSANKPQWYPECAHLEVKGQGEGFPGEEYLAKIPGVYSMDQPEINIDIYAPEVASRTEYKIPGPPVWTG